MVSYGIRIKNVLLYMRAEIFPEMTMTQFNIFMEVAVYEGINQGDIVKRSFLPRNTISRNMSTLSLRTKYVRGQEVVKGLDLVECRPDRAYPARNTWYLTQKGKKTYSAILSMLEEEFTGPVADVKKHAPSKGCGDGACEAGCTKCVKGASLSHKEKDSCGKTKTKSVSALRGGKSSLWSRFCSLLR
jgi:hypothetical protein